MVSMLFTCKSNLKPGVLYPKLLICFNNYYYWLFTGYCSVGNCTQLGNSCPLPSVLFPWVVSNKILALLTCAIIHKIGSWLSTLLVGKFTWLFCVFFFFKLNIKITFRCFLCMRDVSVSPSDSWLDLILYLASLSHFNETGRNLLVKVSSQRPAVIPDLQALILFELCWTVQLNRSYTAEAYRVCFFPLQ